ncbi:MAG: EF-P lysine aminoacylase GenX [Deltaproteobacteria bacterium]|nr:EF-P lysine aminoacylase GenX [Deltaproteobacteria bacterium]
MLNARNENLWFRARVVQAIRAFFIGRGYLEVETPHRIPAPAPEAHIDAVGSEGWYLHTSPELCMKRLLAVGHPRLFQVCRCFRKGERGRRHLPEFTMLEWYRAGADYRGLMEETEELVGEVAATCGGRQFDLSRPWERLTVAEAFARFTTTTPEAALADGSFDERVAFEIEPHLGQGRPLFLCDYPAPLAALARRKPGNPSVAERFELYLQGVELANGFSELTDVAEQRDRFAAERGVRAAAGKDPYPLPERFLEDLARLPESAGIALGVDRLVMLLAGAETIDEVVAFAPEEL